MCHFNLKRLTIVIITYKRQSYALRNMKYWSGREPCIKVLDGSPQPINNVNSQELMSNVQYKHDPRTLYERLNCVLGEISTEYVALMCDDEFYIPTALSVCIDELDNDASLVTCTGCSLGFYIRNGQVFGKDAYNKLINYTDVMLNSPVDRLNAHMGNYVPSIIFGVSRTKVWSDALKTVVNKKFNFFASWEIHFEMLMSFYGKAKVINELMWLRSFEVEPIRNLEPKLESNISLKEWFDNDLFYKEKNEFVRVTAQAFYNNYSYYRVNNDAIVNDALAAYLGQVKILPKKTIKQNILNLFAGLPDPIINILRIILRGKHVKFYALSLRDQAALLENKGVNVNYRELDVFEKIICDFNK